ncbi:phage-related baseplate assembly protein [Lachnospiraceae bacterium KM106-2]|nr:phage-related baseplate assembly protein [Lachnospiraceae bacterium KM106-2]
MSDFTLDNYPEISFIDNKTIDDVKNELVADYSEEYERTTGESVNLSQADPTRILLYSIAMLFYQGLKYVDNAGKQNLLKYSFGDNLDNLGLFKNVERNQPKAAQTTIRFSLQDVREISTIIPQGTRAFVSDDILFETTKEAEIPVGSLYVDVICQCTQTGLVGNGFLPGEIKQLSDTVPYIASISNLTKTEGGCDLQDDDDYKECINLGPASFSTAGSEPAYKYWVKKFNSSISDVKITSPSACVVDIRIILDGGELPTDTLITELITYLSDDSKRPLTDKVQVAAPDTVDYSLSLTYYIAADQKSSEAIIKSNVEAAISQYVTWQSSRIGRDINPDMLNHLIIAAGAKRVAITTPIYTVVSEKSLPKLTDKSIVYGGLEDD